MNNIKLKTSPGELFNEVAQRAKEIASIEPLQNVQFKFNEIKCIVSKGTNLDLLYRDYHNAFTMDWKSVGPDCHEKYSAEIQAELDERTAIREVKHEHERVEQEAKELRERQLFEEKTKGIDFEIQDKELWDDWKSKNSDPYGACIFEYAEAWAKLMQAELLKGVPVSQSFEKTSYELGFFGITGFMYGAAVGTLSKCWKHGEALRVAHNKQYKHEGEGVVNPAILTIG